MTEWRDLFCGREAELKQLVDAYESVAAGAGPRLAVVCADRGMGKTRLVQELYRHLSTTCDPDEYWPDASQFKGNNLRVAPDFNDPETKAHFGSFTTAQRPMPFLWWGFRLNDPLDRNAVRSDMAGHRRALDPHLERACFAREHAAKRAAVKHSSKDIARDAALKIGEAVLDSVPGVVLGKSLIEVGISVFKTARSHARARQQEDEFAKADLAGLERQREEDIYERTLEDLASVLAPAAGMPGVPAVVFCDDAQFAREGGDEGAMRFLDQLWKRAEEGRWPLLLVATHWAVDWEQDQRQEAGSFARLFTDVANDEQASTIVPLSKESGLGAMVEQGLPGLPRQDVELLLRKVDGNPQVLIELVGRIQASPAWRNRQGALSPHGRKQIEEHSCNLTTLITERLLSDSTPPEVRLAVALSSLQGMQFLCPLTEAAAHAMQLGAVGSGMSVAAQPLRLVVGVDAGVASFVQRAYRDAARSLVPTELGDPQDIKEGLLAAAVALVECEPSWNGLAPPQQRALLGVVASLGGESADQAWRAKAGQALIRLIGLDQDCAGKGQHARTFTEGLGKLWSADQFSEDSINLVRVAIENWDGSSASYKLDKILVDDLRRLLPHDLERARHLTHALLRVAAHERRLDGHDEARARLDEAVELAQTLYRASSEFNESDLADTLELAAVQGLYEPAEVASRRRLDALELRRARFRSQYDQRSCEQLVWALRSCAGDCEPMHALAMRQEAVEAARTLAAFASTDAHRNSAARLLSQALANSLVSVFPLGFMLIVDIPQAGDCEEALPAIAELIELLREHADWRTNEEELYEVIRLGAVGALVANRAGKRELARSLFASCEDFANAAAVDLEPWNAVEVHRMLALSSLFKDDIGSALAHAADAVRTALGPLRAQERTELQNQCWGALQRALAFELRLKRSDLLVLLEPDPTEDDEAAALPELLAAMRQTLPEWVGAHSEAAHVFYLIESSLSQEIEHQRLDSIMLQTCVGEVRLLMSEYEAQHDRATWLDKLTESWLRASLAVLCLAARASSEDEFEYFWELVMGLIQSALQAERTVGSLETIYFALDDSHTVLRELEPDIATSLLEVSVAVARAIADRTEDPIDRGRLAYLLTTQANSRMRVADLAEAAELVTESMTICSKLVGETESLHHLHRLRYSLETKEILASRLGDQMLEQDARLERVRTLERIVAISGGEQGQQDLDELSRTLGTSDRATVVLH